MTTINERLFHAAEQGNFNEVEACIRQGANVLEKYQNRTVLHAAMTSNDERIVQLVLETLKTTGENIENHLNTKNVSEETALMWAARNGKIRVAQLLLNHGASIYVKNQANQTAFECAIKQGHHLGLFNLSVKEQLKLAIDNHHGKLIQVLLGPECCQLWHYWLAHATVSY